MSSEFRPLMAGNLFPDDTSVLEPPEPIPNSAVKRRSADGSVGSPHVRVGRRQDFYPKPRLGGAFLCAYFFDQAQAKGYGVPVS